MLIILAIFSLTQLVCSQFQEMVHGVFLASQSGSGPAGERRGLVSARQPETSRGGGISFFWLTLIRFYWHLLVCVNAGITARAGASFLSSSENISLGSGRRASVTLSGHRSL